MRPFRLLSVVAAGAAAVVVACGEPFGLLAPSATNFVDTVSLYALRGTPVVTPSGYYLPGATTVRTDQSSVFDFAFDIDTTGQAVLLPTGAMRLGQGSGIQVSQAPFDSIRFAPDRGYQRDSAVVVDSGTVAIIHSRPTTCGFALSASYAYYAKLQVLRLDSAARRLDFKILVDRNCGYRGLEPGLPSR